MNSSPQVNQNYHLKELNIYDIEIPSECSDLSSGVLDEIICHLCLCIVRDPISCSNCEEMTCSKCIQKALEKTKTCPKCKLDYIERSIPKKVRNILDNMEILCPNNNSCKIRTKYPFLLKDHLASCPYTPRIATCVACQAQVRTTNKLTEIEEHISSCELVQVSCPFCNTMVTRQCLQEHKDNCEERSIECDDCKTFISIQKFDKHNKKECINNIKKYYDTKMESYAKEKCDEIYTKINNALNCNSIEIKVTDKYDNIRLLDLLSLGIKKLELSNYPIEISTLASLKHNSAIQFLNLSKAGLTDENALILAEVLENNNSLKFLDLSYNSISYKGAEALLNALVNNKSLEYLSISGNVLDTSNIISNLFNKLFSKVTHNFGETLKRLLEKNASLKVLCLAECGLTSDELTSLYLGMKYNTSLTYLVLSGNPMSYNNKVMFEELMKSKTYKLEIILPFI
jgi:hypothetical protein